jgi:hypothetical protein
MTQMSLFEKTDEEIKYEAFVDKFVPKKTTDDCYTPPAIYKAIKDYVVQRYCLKGKNILRPFYPGGDYQKENYTPNDVVIDNPPFSIITPICKWYEQHGVLFFLFAPYLTILSGRLEHTTAIITDTNIIYDNGADIPTSFLTNLENEYICRNDIELAQLIKKTSDSIKTTRSLPKYKYPNYIVTAAMLGKYTHYDVPYGVKRGDGVFVSQLDSQREKKKSIYGKGLLLCEKAAAEKAAAEKAAAEKAETIEWPLSEREWAIIKQLGGASHGNDES